MAASNTSPTANTPAKRTHPKVADPAMIRAATELRLKRMSYREISKELGISLETVFRYVQRGMKDLLPVEDLEQVRKQELAELDLMSDVCFRLLSGVHEFDQGPAVMAIFDRLVKIQDRRARLLGLDAATKIDAKVQVSNTVDAEIEALVAQMSGGEVVSDPLAAPGSSPT